MASATEPFLTRLATFQFCVLSRLLHGPTGAAVPAQHSAKQTALPATEIARLHLTSHIPGKLCRLQQRKRKSTLYVVGSL
ncbi:hypothetical protein AV530_007708 [Patagioenas fasciata monilis]|uniref:Uncharacterized protein n=1 Tax=Patagioenas fasciata monilis TaxID=372326 RepID=A0A1V4JZ40_PATFA|nr:hypothetical protein AV530_007708 [Patagioenas fasciata monilis]